MLKRNKVHATLKFKHVHDCKIINYDMFTDLTKIYNVLVFFFFCNANIFKHVGDCKLLITALCISTLSLVF